MTEESTTTADQAMQNTAAGTSDASVLDRIAAVRRPEPQAEQAPAPETEAVEQVPEQEAPVETVEAEQAEPEQPQWRTLQDLIEAAGIEADQVDNLIFRAATDDEPELTLGEIRNGQLRQADYTRKTQELAEQRANLDQARIAQEQEVASRLEIANQVLQGQHAALKEQVDAIDWNTLRNEDPAEYAAKISDFQRQEQALQAQHQQLQTAVQQQAAKQAETMRSQWVKAEQDAMAKLRESRPEATQNWGSFVQERAQYLNSVYGVDPQRLMPQMQGQTIVSPGLVVDPVALDVAWKAEQYDKLMSAKPEPKKTAKTRAIRPRSTGGQKTQEQRDLDAARDQARANPNKRSAANRLGALRRAQKAGLR